MTDRGRLLKMFIEMEASPSFTAMITKPMKTMSDEEKNIFAAKVVELGKDCKTAENLLKKMQEKGYI